MSPEENEQDRRPVDEFLRYLRGRGPRPRIDGLGRDERAGAEELRGLLVALVDTRDGSEPPLGDDPVAIRLGLVDAPGPGGPDPAARDVDPGLDPVTVALDELAHRLGGEVEVEAVDEGAGPGHRPAPGLRARALCRTLGELVLVCSTDTDDLADLPGRLAGIFAARPTTTAVAVVSTASLLAVVLTEADCVRAIDPLEGWVEPALPLSPEPFGLALGRYLEGSLPRWDEIARLDEMLVLTRDDDDLTALVGEAVHDHLDRPVRITAKRAALQALRALPSSDVVAVVNDVRAGHVGGDDLIRRIRGLSEVGAP
jgi:hypothetical protein